MYADERGGCAFDQSNCGHDTPVATGAPSNRGSLGFQDLEPGKDRISPPMTVAGRVVRAIGVVHVKRAGYFPRLTTTDLLQANDVRICRPNGQDNTVKILFAALKKGAAGF